MKRARTIVLGGVAALALGALPGPSSAAAAGDYWRDCGERVVGEALIVETKAHAVSCRIARRIAKRYASRADDDPLGFECGDPRTAPHGETTKVTCRRKRARVKVIFGI